MATDLDTWADAQICSDEMTAEAWDEARACALSHFNANRAADQRFTCSQARALLAARDRVIAGLTDRERRQLLDAGEHTHDCEALNGLEEAGLMVTYAHTPWHRTPLGHEIAAELQRREEAGNE